MTNGRGWNPGQFDVQPTAKKENESDTNQNRPRRKRSYTTCSDVRAIVFTRLRTCLSFHGVPANGAIFLSCFVENSDENGECELSIADIVRITGLSESTVHDYARSMKRKHWLWVEYRPDVPISETNVWTLLPDGEYWERGERIHDPRERKPKRRGVASRTHFSPSSIAPPAVAAVGLSEGSAEGAAVDDAPVSGEPVGLESRGFEGGDGGSAAEPSVDDVLGVAPGEEIQRNPPLLNGDGAPSAAPLAPQEAAQEQPAPLPRRRTGASPLAPARAHTRVAFALTFFFGDLGLDEKAMRSWSSQVWTLFRGRGVAHVELLLLALSVLFNQRRKAMEKGDENPWTKPAEEVRRYLYRTFTKMDLPTYATATALYWEVDPSCPWKAEHDAAVARGETYGVAPPAILPHHDQYKRRPSRDYLYSAVDHSRSDAQVDPMPEAPPSIANDCARLILAAFGATYHDVKPLADLADDVALANRLAQRSEEAAAGGTLTTEDVLSVVRHFATIQAFDQKRSGIAKAGPQLTSYLSKQLRAAKRGCAATLTAQTKGAKYIEIKPKISTAQPSGGLAHLTREKKRLTPEEITALRKSVERKSS